MQVDVVLSDYRESQPPIEYACAVFGVDRQPERLGFGVGALLQVADQFAANAGTPKA
jgi:hypothetical protein